MDREPIGADRLPPLGDCRTANPLPDRGRSPDPSKTYPSLADKRREAHMAQAPFSTIESTLENQPLGGLQIRVAAICTLIQMCDGYDVGSIGWAVPS